MIKLTDVEKFYESGAGKTWVLRRINVDIREGEFVTVMGPILSAAVAAQAAASLALMARGVVIILFLIFEPRGLVHLWGMVKAYVRLWPFSHEEAE